MKVVILCGGKGTRLGEVTGDTVPKPMVRIGEEPILWHIMELYSRAGHREFILCVGHLSWSIKEYFLNFHAQRSDVKITTGAPESVRFLDVSGTPNWDITIAETGGDTMTAGRLQRVAKYLDEGSFMLTYGDGVSDIDLDRLLAFHQSHGKMITMTGVVPPGRFGELALAGQQVVEMTEKPQSTDRYINGGFMVVRREFIDAFIAAESDDVMLEREPFSAAAEAGEMMLYRHGGYWQCMDTMRDWELLNSLWKAGAAPWNSAATRVDAR